jgi:hypothetical protein
MTKAEIVMEKVAISAGIAVRSLERRLDAVEGAVLPGLKQVLKKRTEKQVSNIGGMLAEKSQKASVEMTSSNAGAKKLREMANKQFDEQRASESFNYAAGRLKNI